MEDIDWLPIIKKAIKITKSHKFRIKNSKGKPGGLLEIPESIKPIIVGDLHGNVHNFKQIVEHENNAIAIENEKGILIILGDAVHNDQTGYIREMESSLTILEYLFTLFDKYEEHVIYIRGNHDTFDDRLVKSAIKQGLEFKNLLLARRGEDYTDLVEEFFDCLPVFIVSQQYIITHAGPVRGGITRQELIDIEEYPDKYKQLLWNRINEFRGNPSEKEYFEKDIQETIKKLGLPPETHFIVGHNPLWNNGNTIGFWENVLGIKNHHILYSGSNTRAPYLTFENGKLKLKCAVTAKPEVYYV